jgi:hypothetical protein
MVSKNKDLSMKQGSLFVLFCHVKISETLVHVALLVSSRSSWWVGVHQLGLRLLGGMVWKQLIIEPFFQWKIN